MSAPAIRLAFFKLGVSNMEKALAFYQEAFGFSVKMTFDEPDFIEHIMALPGQEAGPNLLLLQYKDGRHTIPGNAYGPVGFMVEDMDATYQAALEAGGTALLEPFVMDGTRVATLQDPEGHEIELVQPVPAEDVR
ncbi:VOC family protein [Altericroceibacterium spongiae]|nr:VOC family protein [Altericroceibacterium spongiae]